MHDKENIFVSLVKSALVHYTQNISLIDIRVIS